MKLKISKIQDMYHRLFHNKHDSIDFSEHIEFIGSVCFDPKIENKKIRSVSIRRGYDNEYYLEIPDSHLESANNMKTISALLAPYKSYYAASKQLGPSIKQLQRWETLGAKVDNTGQVWIKTGQPIKL
jgi:hypothetical protein